MKLKLTLGIAVYFSSIVYCLAADKYFFGGINFAHAIEKSSSGSKYVYLPVVGVNGGVLFEKRSNPRGFSFASGLIWMNKGFRQKNYDYINNEEFLSVSKYRMNILDIPFLLKWSKELPNDMKFHLSTGPGLGFELFTKYSYKGDGELRKSIEYSIFLELDYWLTAGIDYKQLSFRAFYNFGIVTPITLMSSEPGMYRNRVVGVSVGYILPDKKNRKGKLENQQEQL